MSSTMTRPQPGPANGGAQVSQPAVSPVSNRQAPANSERAETVERPADWKSATQQIGNLRYEERRFVSAYQFLAEVLLYPEDRDARKLALSAEMAGRAAPELRDAIESLMASPELDDCDTYLETFEIGAKCPLYLGHYLFEEPNNCRGAAISGRNGYMIQLKNLYRHFGFDSRGGELPDYLPLMLDFLALSAGHPARKHRRLLVKQFMLPALPALGRALRDAGNVYAPIAGMLEQLLRAELEETSFQQSPTPSLAHCLGAGEASRPSHNSEAVKTPSPLAPRAERGGVGERGAALELKK